MFQDGTISDGFVNYISMCIFTTNLLRTADSFLQHIDCILSLPLTQRSRFITALGFHRNHTTILQTLEQTAATQRAVPHLTWGAWSTIVIRTHWSHGNNRPLSQLHFIFHASKHTEWHSHRTGPRWHRRQSLLGAGWYHFYKRTPLW